MASDLYIIAAGKGSRMGGNVPKALVPITDEPCLTTTLKQVGAKFEHVFVVVNVTVLPQWKKYQQELQETFPSLLSNVTFLSINSGLGDGHAVMSGFFTAGPKVVNNDVVIMWGDVFVQNAELFDELLSQPMLTGLIPAVRENNPYVTLLVDNRMNCVSADFSKYGENHPSGFHDQSVFRFTRNILWDALSTLHSAFWKNGRYITPGGELSLLHAFHYLYNSEQIVQVYETAYPTLSFNTPEEVASIQLEINRKWKTKHQSS